MNKLILYSHVNSWHISRNLSLFEELGYECRMFRWLDRDFFRRPFAVYLNWYESVKVGNIIATWTKFLLHIITLRYAKFTGIKIIASFHNKEPHNNAHPRMANYLFDLVFHLADRIVIFNEGGRTDLKRYLTEKEIEEKAVCIPPVSYIGAYPYVRHEWIANVQEKQGMKILMAGTLSQSYKNAEMLMDIAAELKDKDIEFVFAGKTKGEKQTALFEEKTKGLIHVTTAFRYVEDNEMAHLLEMCDVLIIPYNVESINNSGTARMAFSYGRTVICPRIPSLEAIPEELVYEYEYRNHEDHRHVLKQQILTAYNEWQNNHESLHQKGERLKHLMEENNSPEVVKERYRQLFNSLEK